MISKSIILLMLAAIAVTSVAATSPITTMLTVVSAQTSGNNGNTVRPANQQFLNLANTTWTLYNETRGSTSIMKFNSDGTYARSLHDNNLTGNWQSSIVADNNRYNYVLQNPNGHLHAY